MLTNNEIKDIKASRSLENRAILLKGTAKNVANKKGWFLDMWLLH